MIFRGGVLNTSPLLIIVGYRIRILFDRHYLPSKIHVRNKPKAQAAADALKTIYPGIVRRII